MQVQPHWEHDARVDGGGFAALGASCRRVAGVSRLYWCNSPPVCWRPRRGASPTVRLSWRNSPLSCPGMKGVAPKPQPRAAWPRGPHPSHLHPGTMGAFAPLEAFCRRVAGVSRLYWCNSPLLVAVRSRFGAVRSPHRRPPRRKTPTKGCRGRGGLRCGHNSARPGGSLAREPVIACANRLYRTSTRYSVSGRGCPRSHQRVNVRISGPTLTLAGPGADQRAHVRGVGPACAASTHPRSSFACNSIE